MTPAEDQSRVAVVGAGLAGLRAADDLDRAGRAVTVFEARPEAGGRVGGEWRADHWMDSAWPVLGGRDPGLSEWIVRSGLGDVLHPLRPVQTALLVDGDTRPIDARTLRGAARTPGPRPWERLRLLRWGRLSSRYAPRLDVDEPERAAPLDYRSVRDHAELYLGSRLLESWLAPEIQSVWGDSVERLSRVALLLHAYSVGVGEARPALPGLPRRPLVELVQRVAERLDLRLSTAVERIDEEPAGGFRIEWTDASGIRESAHYDAVVVATGPTEAARMTALLLTPAERDHFAAVREQPTVTLAAAIEGVHGGLPQEIRIPRAQSPALSTILIEPGRPEGRAPEGASQLVALARDEFARRRSSDPDDVVTKRMLQALEHVRPGVGARVKSARVGRTLRPFLEVGAFRRLERFQRVQRDRRALGRRLYFAGDHLAGPSFEAATRSGARAATAVLHDLRQGAGSLESLDRGE